MSAPSPLPEPSSSGGTGLLAALTVATLAGVAVIAAFCMSATWWLLPVVVAALLVITGAVVTGLVRLMDHDSVFAASRSVCKPAEETASSQAPAPRAARPALPA